MKSIATCLLLACLIGCQGPSMVCFEPHQYAAEAEALAGARAAVSLESRHGGLCCDPIAMQRLSRLGSKLVDANEELTGEFKYALLDSDKIDAFSLPGGRVYMTRGLYQILDDDNMLSAVIAHEIAHIVARDHFKPRPSSRARALKREQDADTRGVAYLVQANLPGDSMSKVVRAIRDMQPDGWVEERCCAIANKLTTYAPEQTLAMAYP